LRFAFDRLWIRRLASLILVVASRDIARGFVRFAPQAENGFVPAPIVSSPVLRRNKPKALKV
jgi:hypothetical protein